jgi:hypothetical protein
VRRNSRAPVLSPRRITTDQYFASVLLLLHFDGASGSTANPIDNSPSPKTVTLQSAAQLSSNQRKFGPTSMQSSYARLAASQGVTLATGDFTIEGWVRTASDFLTESMVIAKSTTTGFWQFRLSVLTTALLRLRCYDDLDALVVDVTGATTLSAGTWYYFAAVRSGSLFHLFVDGVLDATSSAYAGSLRTADEAIGILAVENGVAPLVGYMDDLRITTVARYTSTFAVPTAAHPDS